MVKGQAMAHRSMADLSSSCSGLSHVNVCPPHHPSSSVPRVRSIGRCNQERGPGKNNLRTTGLDNHDAANKVEFLYH